MRVVFLCPSRPPEGVQANGEVGYEAAFMLTANLMRCDPTVDHKLGARDEGGLV